MLPEGTWLEPFKGISCPVLGSIIAAEPRNKPTVPQLKLDVGVGVCDAIVGGAVLTGGRVVVSWDTVGVEEVRATDMEVSPSTPPVDIGTVSLYPSCSLIS